MKVFYIQIIPEDKPEEFFVEENEFDDLKLKDKVIVRTKLGADLGEIVKMEAAGFSKEAEKEEIKKILRKTTTEDIEKYKKRNQNKKEAIEGVKKIIKNKKLPLKVINLIFSFDGSRVTVIFTAPSRIDFRELVKDLSHYFHRSVRMLQVGVRDEAESKGDIGPCGQILCCRRFLKKIGPVSTGLLSEQQLFSRGPERMSGVCGRLKCCLAFEEEVYKELTKNLPAIGTEIKVGKRKGKVVERQILKQKVIVETKDGERLEIGVNKLS